MDTRTMIEYEVTHQFDGDAGIDGEFYDTLDEAREAFEDECASPDPNRYKTVRLHKVECDYEGEECVEVRDVETIETRTV